MKTEQEIRQMVNACNLYRNCGGCPYNPEDISRFIGRGRWKGGCPNYDRKLVYAMGKGYGDVSEYKAEIEQLKNANSGLTDNLVFYKDKSYKLEKNVDKLKTEIEQEVKQAQIDILNELKSRHDYAVKNMGYPWDISQQIDKLLTEVDV